MRWVQPLHALHALLKRPLAQETSHPLAALDMCLCARYYDAVDHSIFMVEAAARYLKRLLVLIDHIGDGRETGRGDVHALPECVVSW